MFIGLSYMTYNIGYVQAKSEVHETEQHDDCHDTKTHEAWIAKKNGELRCFLESRQYPHRVRGTYLDNSQDVQPSGSQVEGEAIEGSS